MHPFGRLAPPRAASRWESGPWVPAASRAPRSRKGRPGQPRAAQGRQQEGKLEKQKERNPSGNFTGAAEHWRSILVARAEGRKSGRHTLRAMTQSIPPGPLCPIEPDRDCKISRQRLLFAFFAYFVRRSRPIASRFAWLEASCDTPTPTRSRTLPARPRQGRCVPVRPAAPRAHRPIGPSALWPVHFRGPLSLWSASSRARQRQSRGCRRRGALGLARPVPHESAAAPLCLGCAMGAPWAAPGLMIAAADHNEALGEARGDAAVCQGEIFLGVESGFGSGGRASAIVSAGLD